MSEENKIEANANNASAPQQPVENVTLGVADLQNAAQVSTWLFKEVHSKQERRHK